MKRGHVTGTRQQRASASDWYRKIEAATLARLEQAWLETNAPTEEMTQDITQDVRTRTQGSARTTHT